MNKLQFINRSTWVIVGLLLIILTSLGISTMLDIKATTEDMRNIISQATMDDVRSFLNLVEKNIDKEIVQAELEKLRFTEADASIQEQISSLDKRLTDLEKMMRIALGR